MILLRNHIYWNGTNIGIVTNLLFFNGLGMFLWLWGPSLLRRQLSHGSLSIQGHPCTIKDMPATLWQGINGYILPVRSCRPYGLFQWTSQPLSRNPFTSILVFLILAHFNRKLCHSWLSTQFIQLEWVNNTSTSLTMSRIWHYLGWE